MLSLLLASATEPAVGDTTSLPALAAGVVAGAELVNKKELAALIGCSLPTLAAWVDRYGDAFPVSDRGTNGREWRFDAAAVIGFLQARRAEEEREAAERAARLQQFALPGLTVPPDIEGVSKPADLLALARVRAMHRQEERETGLLVPTTDVRMVLTAALAKLNRFLNSVLTQLARKHGWSDAQLRDAQALFHEAQRAFVRDAGTFAPEDPAPGGLFEADPDASVDGAAP